jgi:hypothetical protein
MSNDLGSTPPPQLTPYPTINAAVDDLLPSLRAILGAQVLGVYLVGSLALGDFDPQTSDLDLIIVTTGTLADAIIAALRELHQRFGQSGSAWAERIDAVYIPQEALREPSPTAANYPILEWPGLLALAPLESGWPIQRYTLREYGIVVGGPDPHALLDPVDPDDLRQASATIVERWHDQAHGEPDWSTWLRARENQSFVVMTLCRVLYTLETGAVASKPAAARWVDQSLPAQWSGLIGRTRAEQLARQDASADEVNETLALLEYTFDRYQQWRASMTNRQK